MATTIGSLAVKLTASGGQFSAQMSKASKTVTALRSSVNVAARSVLKWGGILTSVAAGGGMAIMLKRTFESIDATTKFADRLGIATDKLTALHYAAQLTGNTTDTLNRGLQKMTAGIYDAVQGTGEASAALKSLGLDATTLAAMSPDRQFRAIGDALEGVASQSDRVGIAFRIFGARGAGLLNTLRGGSAAMDEYEKRARELGIAFSRIDAAKIEMANDAITSMRASFGGLFNTIAIQVAPIIKTLADDVTTMMKSMAGDGTGLYGAIRQFGDGLVVVYEIMGLIRAAWEALQGVVRNGVASMLRPMAILAKAINAISEATGNGKFAALEYIVAAQKSLVKDAKRDFKEAGEAFDNVFSGKTARDVKARVEAAIEAARKLFEGTARENPAISAAGKMLESIATTIAELRGQSVSLGFDAEAAKISQLQTAIDGYVQALSRAGATAEQFLAGRDAAEAMRREVARLGVELSGQKVFAGIAEEIEALRGKVITFGIDADAQKVVELNAALDAYIAKLKADNVPTDLFVNALDNVQTLRNEMARLNEELAGKKAAKEMADAAAEVFEQTRTPMERYEKTVGDLDKLLNSGAITWDTYGRAVRQAREQLESMPGVGDLPALEAGSAAAFSAVNRLSQDIQAVAIAAGQPLVMPIAEGERPQPIRDAAEQAVEGNAGIEWQKIERAILDDTKVAKEQLGVLGGIHREVARAADSTGTITVARF